MKTKYFLVLSVIIALVTGLSGNISAALSAMTSDNVAAYGLDTIAGHSTVLRTSKMPATTDIEFVVKKPSGETVLVPAQTNAQGVAITDLSDYHTKLAGEYQVALRYKGGEVTQWNDFEVYSGETSLQYSTIDPPNTVASVMKERVSLTVRIVDDYENPVPGHQVKLISTSDQDSIELVSDKDFTDENGEISFVVNGATTGPVTYSAYDVTADVVLEQKSKVVYTDSSGYLFSAQEPSYNYAAVGNASGPIDHFEFEDIPEDIEPGDPMSLKLTAYDENDEVVMNYLGEVRFSVSGSNSAYADLPDDYTFKAEDQGSHTFSLAFNFQKPGTYELRATDTDDLTIFAIQNIRAIEASAVNTQNEGDAKIKILTPLPGTYSAKMQVISGTATPASGLKIFDNDVAIASLVTDLQGKFSYTANSLADGEHTIYVAEVNADGTIVDVSESLIFNIDTAAPKIREVVFDPKGEVVPGSLIKVKMVPDVALSQAAVMLLGQIVDLEKKPDGSYEGIFAAPIEFGEYKVDFILTDELGNESRLREYSSFKVGAIDISAKTKPAVVQNLAVKSDDRKISLSWDPVRESTNPIVRYRVYYGLSPNELVEAVDTFTSEPSWYVYNLVNGSEYYFAVVAVDSKGNISENFSNIVVGVPNPIVVDVLPVGVYNGTEGAEALKEIKRDPAQAGPEVLWLVISSMLAGYFYVRFSKKMV